MRHIDTASASGQGQEIQPLLCNKREAARLLSLSLRTIDNLIGRKELPSIRIGGRVMIRTADIYKFIKHDHQTCEVQAA